MEIKVYVDPWKNDKELKRLTSWSIFVTEPVEVDRVFEVTYHVKPEYHTNAQDLASKISYVPLQVKIDVEGGELTKLEERFLTLATAVVVQKSGYKKLWTDYYPNYDAATQLLSWSHNETNDLFYVPPKTPTIGPIELPMLGEDWQYALGPDPILPWIASTVISPSIPTLDYHGIPMVSTEDERESILTLQTSIYRQPCFWVKLALINQLGGGDVWGLERMPTSPMINDEILVKAQFHHFGEDWIKYNENRSQWNDPVILLPWHLNRGSPDDLIQARLFEAAASIIEDASILPWYNSDKQLVTVHISSAKGYHLWLKQLDALPSRTLINVPENTDDGILQWLWDNHLLIKLPNASNHRIRLWSYMDIEKVIIPESSSRKPFDRTLPTIDRANLADAYRAMNFIV